MKQWHSLNQSSSVSSYAIPIKEAFSQIRAVNSRTLLEQTPTSCPHCQRPPSIPIECPSLSISDLICSKSDEWLWQILCLNRHHPLPPFITPQLISNRICSKSNQQLWQIYCLNRHHPFPPLITPQRYRRIQQKMQKYRRIQEKS